MRISVFGLGYVGAVCSACLAERGHSIIGVDKAEAKVDLIRSGRSPIIEPGIEDLIKRNVDAKRLVATLDGAEAVASTDISLVCVGTPSQPNGALSLAAIEAVSTEIGQAIRSKPTRHEVVIRSTVVPGTTRQVIAPKLVEGSGRVPGNGLGLAFNPEFLREGSSVADFNTPSKTIVGALDEMTAAHVISLYDDLPGAKIATGIETAEFVKYVDNAWHALKVTFANEIGVLATSLQVDSREVMRIFFEDNRLNISNAYLQPGFAFGGSCLPKDLRALTYLGRKLDLNLPVLNHILASNRMIVERGVEWIVSQSKKRVAFLGISFKAGTDDLRDSPFIELVERLTGKGYEVRIFDSNVRLAQLMGSNKDYLMEIIPHIADLMVPSISDAIEWAEVVVVTTSDPAYKAGLNKVKPEQTVLEFSDIKLPSDVPVRRRGFLWREAAAT
jgi:GDP-mannose 6-dehydrogenase